MLPRCIAITMLLVLMQPAGAEDDPQEAAAYAKCPGAAAFVRLHPKPSPPDIADPAARLTDLRIELLRMQTRDQEARSGDWSQEDIRQMMQVDAEHLPRIKQIVAEHGFPEVELVGRDGVDAAWLLVQHADADPAFQEQVLAAITPRVRSGEISRHQFILLTDRVLAGQGKPQRYGSQLLAQEGRWVPKPIEAPESEVDQRRAAMGDMPLADYICMATQMFPPPP
ncbi:DUF6624 domain-containing protein [Pseudoxanthomonas beigongshangi]